MHDVFVLAAGFGTRLRPLTLDRPKPLVPVVGIPLLHYSLALAARHGMKDVVVNAHYLADQLVPLAGECEGCTVTVAVEEPEILGTGGGLRAVVHDLAPAVAVLNGDVLHNVDLSRLVAEVAEGGGAMALRPDPEHAESYGIVAADDTGTVVRLVALAEATPDGAVHHDTHFTGIHAVSKGLVERVPAEGFACIVRSAYVDAVPERLVRGIRYEGPWLDAGNPQMYLDTNLMVLRGEVELALEPMERAGFAQRGDRRWGDESLVEGVEVEGPVWVGKGAQIAPGSRLRDAVVGERASVSGTLQRAVVWDGAHHVGELTDGVVHDSGTWVKP